MLENYLSAITWHQLINIIVDISTYRNIGREDVNANLSMPLLSLGTSPLTVVPTTGHGKELEEPWGRKGEQHTQFEPFFF